MTDLLKQPPRIVNIGLTSFYDDLCEQQAEAVQVNWQPPLDVSEPSNLGDEIDDMLNMLL